ncbi:hypothetical protein ABZ468_25860 [Streptomyces sp. NPDC005708]|uniref:hypothetical protein n=1 Tax=Streptomyces sp. NPDC005708 TaxID=3154564 RepID=UPI0033DDCB3A
MSLFIVLSTAACGAKPTAVPERSQEPSTPASVAGVTGYLYKDPSVVAFLEWKANAGGELEGTIDRATASGTSPNATVETSTGPLTGRIDGRSVTLQIDFHTDYGSLSDDALTLNVRQSDGSIRALAYHQASPSDYNEALAALRKTVTGDNDRAQQDQQIKQEVQALEDDYKTVGEAKGTLKDDLSALASDVAAAGDDLKSTHGDEQAVIAEAHETDSATVCGDADGVSGDADGVSGDADGVSGDLDTLTSDMSALRKAVSGLRSSLGTVQRDMPAYNGADAQPAPADVEGAITGAQSFISNLVTQVNGYIDKINAHVMDAYGYAAAASKAGKCGTAPSAPAPVAHIK